MENQIQNQTVINKNNEIPSEQNQIGDATTTPVPDITMKFSDSVVVTNETSLKNTIIKKITDDGDKQIDTSDTNSEIENVPKNTELFESLQDKLDTFKNDFMTLVDVLQSEEIQNNVTENFDKSSLSLLADYGNSTDDSTDTDSDSDATDSSESSTDADVSCPIISTTNDNGDFRSITYPDESDSSTSSSSSSEDAGSYDSDSSTDNESVKIINKKITEQKSTTPQRPNRNTKDDLRMCDLPPIENLQISVPESKCVEVGNVVSIVEEQVVIAALPNMPPLDIDTVLFLNKGVESLGKIFDIFGPVNHPMYTIRFNNKEDIINKNIEVGTMVYCAPTTEHTSYVLVADLMKVKGSDASWKEDTEPPGHLLDFSDDEEERRMRAKRKNKQQHNADDNSTDRQTSSSTHVTDFEKRKNERNLYLNDRFNNKKKAYNQNSVRPRGFDFTSKWTDYSRGGNAAPHHHQQAQSFRPRHWWGDGSAGPSRFVNPVCQQSMYPMPHHPYFGGNPVFQQSNTSPYHHGPSPPPFPPTLSNTTVPPPPRPDFSLFVAPFHFQQTQMLPPPPPPPPKQRNKTSSPSFSSDI